MCMNHVHGCDAYARMPKNYSKQGFNFQNQNFEITFKNIFKGLTFEILSKNAHTCAILGSFLTNSQTHKIAHGMNKLAARQLIRLIYIMA